LPEGNAKIRLIIAGAAVMSPNWLVFAPIRAA